jgi:hypothetical protein
MVVATEIERTDPKTTVSIQGFITAAVEPTIELLGISIDTSAIPESGFLGRYGVIGRSAFFRGLSSDKKVVFRGSSQADTVTWSSASRGN